MSESVTDLGRHRVERDGDDEAALVAVVEEHSDGHDECTLFPDDASDDELITTWMTAGEDSYVSLDEMR